MSIKWKRQETEKLIALVEQNSCIYNIKSREYFDRIKKANAFNSILKEMKVMKSCITFEEIKRRWRCLRTQYMQEVRSIKQSEESGTGSGDVYVPKLWCFENLNFLKTHTEMRKSKDNTEFSNDSIKPLPKRRKVFEEKEEIADVVCDAFEESGNDLSVLAQGWSSQYAELSRQQKVFARRIISDALFHGCLENLTESTVCEIHNIFEAVAEKLYDPLHSDE